MLTIAFWRLSSLVTVLFGSASSIDASGEELVHEQRIVQDALDLSPS